MFLLFPLLFFFITFSPFVHFISFLPCFILFYFFYSSSFRCIWWIYRFISICTVLFFPFSAASRNISRISCAPANRNILSFLISLRVFKPIFLWAIWSFFVLCQYWLVFLSRSLFLFFRFTELKLKHTVFLYRVFQIQL